MTAFRPTTRQTAARSVPRGVIQFTTTETKIFDAEMRVHTVPAGVWMVRDPRGSFVGWSRSLGRAAQTERMWRHVR